MITLTQQQLLETLTARNQEEVFQEALDRVGHEHYWPDATAMEEAMAKAGYPPFRCEVCAPIRLPLPKVFTALWPVLSQTKFDCVVMAALGELPLFAVDNLIQLNLTPGVLPIEAGAVIAAKTSSYHEFCSISERGSEAKLQTSSLVGSLLRTLTCYGYVVLHREGYALSYGWNGRFEPSVAIAPDQAYALLRHPNGSKEMQDVYDEISNEKQVERGR